MLKVFFYYICHVDCPLLTNFDKTDNVITIKSGNLTMTVANDLITLSNKLPESDTDGLTNATPVIITLTNTGTMDIMKYDVKLVKEILQPIYQL